MDFFLLCFLLGDLVRDLDLVCDLDLRDFDLDLLDLDFDLDLRDFDLDLDLDFLCFDFFGVLDLFCFLPGDGDLFLL